MLQVTFLYWYEDQSTPLWICCSEVSSCFAVVMMHSFQSVLNTKLTGSLKSISSPVTCTRLSMLKFLLALLWCLQPSLLHRGTNIVTGEITHLCRCACIKMVTAFFCKSLQDSSPCSKSYEFSPTFFTKSSNYCVTCQRWTLFFTLNQTQSPQCITQMLNKPNLPKDLCIVHTLPFWPLRFNKSSMGTSKFWTETWEQVNCTHGNFNLQSFKCSSRPHMLALISIPNKF